MKSFAIILLIAVLIACTTNTTKERYEFLPPEALIIEREKQKAILYYHSNKVSEMSLRDHPTEVPGLVVGHARLSWYCKPELDGLQPKHNNYICEVYQHDAAIVSSLFDNKPLKEIIGSTKTHCFGLLSNSSIDCETYMKGHAKRLSSLQYKYDLKKYERAFEKAERYGEYSEFINKYEKNDIGGLGFVHIAIERQKKIQKEADKAKREANKAKDEANKAKEELLKKTRERDRVIVNNFRSNLNVGDDSNCGLVVETKKAIANVQTMAGLMWLKIEDLYPLSFTGCRIENGVYMPPTSLILR